MKNVLTLISFILLFTQEIVASQTIDASIIKLDYIRPQNFSGTAGSVIFDKVKIFRNDMMVILENADEVFDSEIFIRNKFLGFKGKYHSFGFVVDSESFLSEVNEASLLNAVINIDDQRLGFNADHMKLDVQKAALEFNNSRLFCLKDQLLESDADSLLFGCLNNMLVNPSIDGKSATVKIELRDEDENQKINFEGILDSLEMNTDSIILRAKKSDILMSDKEISLDEFKFTCPKSMIIPPLDTDSIIKECLNNAKISNIERLGFGFKFKTKVDADNFYFESQIKTVDMDHEKISGQLSNNEFVFDTYRGRSHSLIFSCKKYLDLAGDTQLELTNGCINNLEASKNNWVIQDNEFDTRYFLNITGVKSSSNKLDLTLGSFQKVTSKDFPEEEIVKGTLSVFDIKAQCSNDETLDDLEIPKMINNCLKSGRVTAIRVIDSKDKNLSKIYKSYDGVMGNFALLERFDPTGVVASQKPVAKDVLVTFDKNAMTLTAQFYFMMGYRDILLSGPARFLDSSSELEIEINKVKLPVPFLGRSTWFASKIFKKFLASGSIRVEKNKIYVKIGSNS